MTGTRVAATVLCMLLTVGFLGMAINPKATVAFAPAIIHVPSGSQTIQEAINNANQGDMILIEAGTFRENLMINKAVTLRGFAKNATFIKAENTSKPVVEIKANNVILHGFTVQNGLVGVGVSGYNFTSMSDIAAVSNVQAGIELEFSHNNIILDSIASSNSFEGVRIGNSTGNLVANNIVTQNENVGIELTASINNRISNNTVAFHSAPSTDQGIWVQEGSNDNTFDGNTILRNSKGVDIYSSSNNIFYHNNFLNNSIQADRDELSPSNYWDNGVEGNYWSDYTGSGPYPIGSTGDTDNFPLLTQWNPVTDNSPPITVDDYDGAWHNMNFTIKLTAADDFSGVQATYYKVNSGPARTVVADGQPYITSESSSNILEYWSVDFFGHEEIPHHILTEIKLDKTSPSGSIIVSNNVSYTTSTSVTLNLSAIDALSGVFQMRFSNTGTIWTPWEPYAMSKAWNLTSGDGVKKVYVQFQDNALLVSPTYLDDVVLDTIAPAVVILSPGNNSQLLSSTVTVEWNGTDSGVGIGHFEVQLDDGSPIDVGTAQKYAFIGLSDGGHIVKVIAFDKVGRSQEATVAFSVNTHLIWYIGIALAAVIAIVGIVVYFFRVRKSRVRRQERSGSKGVG